MSSCRRTCCIDLGFIGVLLSVIFGIAIGVLYFLELLPSALIGAIIAISFAVIALIIFFVTALVKNRHLNNDCICESSGLILTGIVGSLITGFISLTVSLATISVALAVLLGFVGFFFALTIAGIVSLLSCVSGCDCDF